MNIEVGLYRAPPALLRHSLFADRRDQFVGRHEWDLCVTPEGHEIDEYDAGGSEYLVVHDGMRHLTSCRLRPAAQNTMLLDHFADTFTGAEAFLNAQAGRLYELTRFLKAPSLSVHEGAGALLAFAKGLDRFRDERDAVGFVAVVYPAVGRFLRQSGVRFLVLDTAVIGGHQAQLICLTQAVAATRLLTRQLAYAMGDAPTRPTAARASQDATAVAA